MTRDVTDIGLARVGRWCDRQVPPDARHQVRMEYQVRGHTVTLVERRVPWDAPGTEFGPAWTARPVAQLRRTPAGWRLFWPDRNTRWHLIDDVAASPSVTPLLEALEPARYGRLPGQTRPAPLRPATNVSARQDRPALRRRHSDRQPEYAQRPYSRRKK